ncbi:MAG TPA: hypothetical protein VJA47_03560 [archaeon]|nr:hypothetical protein [archaeon]
MNNRALSIGVVVILAVVLVFVALPLSQPTAEVIVKQPLNFKIATMAVCQEKDGQNFCEDKLFYKCGDEVKEVSGPIVCDGKTYNFDLDKLGSGTFNPNWSDPRDADFVANWIAEK